MKKKNTLFFVQNNSTKYFFSLIILFLIFTTLSTFIVLNAQETPIPTISNHTYGDYPDYIIQITLTQYREYLKSNPPLDRLYIQENNAYFLVRTSQLETLEKSGIKILSKENAAEYIRKISTPFDIYNTTGDINGAFHSYSETNTLLTELQNTYPSIAKVVKIGQTVEGREIQALKISDNVSVEESEPNIYIIGCHHAREWISVEIPLLFAQYLSQNYSNNELIKQTINNSQIYIIPIQNPDGLEFSIHTYRLWRKNRKYNGDLTWGIDTNRNYGYMWGYDDEGSSPDTGSEVYRGSTPFSEPETQAVRDFLLNHPPAGLLSYHSYGQIILYPWGYSYSSTPDATKMDEMAAEMKRLIYNVNSRNYTYGPASILYLTNGDTNDWVYGTFKVPTFTIELPPESMTGGGFILPESNIQEIFNENLPALLYYISYFTSNQVFDKRITNIDNNNPKKPQDRLE